MSAARFLLALLLAGPAAAQPTPAELRPEQSATPRVAPRARGDAPSAQSSTARAQRDTSSAPGDASSAPDNTPHALHALRDTPRALRDTPRALRDARRDTEAQRAAAAEAARRASQAGTDEQHLGEARVVAARATRAAEGRLAQAEALAQDAATAATTAIAERAARAASLAPFLPLLHRLERWPAESLLAIPSEPADTLRGLLAMQALIRLAGTEADAFRQAAERATDASRRAEAEAERLTAARAEARAADARLETQLAQARARRAEAQANEDGAARRAREAATRVTDLEQAMARLERERETQARRAPPRPATPAVPSTPSGTPPGTSPGTPSGTSPGTSPGVPLPQIAGPHPMPVAGAVAREFGAAGEAGPARGMTLAAGPRARVVAPCAGRVAFAGPFRSYGHLVIIDCGGGVHLVLARMERLDTATGERVLAGEPVGAMPAEQPQLYVELRRNGQPADPRGFFAGRG